MSRTYVTRQFETIRSAIEERYKAGTVQRQCLQSLIDSPVDDNIKAVVGCLILAEDWEDAHHVLVSYKNIRSSTAKIVQREALNKWEGARHYQTFFEGKGYRLLQPEQMWYLPQMEFIPGRQDNRKDEYGLAKAVTFIPEEKIPLFDEAYKAYLRGRMRDARVPLMRMFYKDLCCTAVLLLPGDKGRQLFGAMTQNATRVAQGDLNRNLMHAHELIKMTCQNMNAPLPDYDLHDFLVVSEVRQSAPKNLVEGRKSGPSMPQINFPKAVEELSEGIRPARLFKSVVRPSPQPENLVGRDGFDLQSVQPALNALVRSGEISANMKKVFNTFAAENAPDIRTYAHDYEMTPAKVMMAYTSVRRALSNMDCENVPRLK